MMLLIVEETKIQSSLPLLLKRCLRCLGVSSPLYILVLRRGRGAHSTLPGFLFLLSRISLDMGMRYNSGYYDVWEIWERLSLLTNKKDSWGETSPVPSVIVFMTIPGAVAAILQSCGELSQQVQEGRTERCRVLTFLLC